MAERLDFLSIGFDPLAALCSAHAQPPVPHARPLDNLHQCRRLLPADHTDHIAPAATAPAHGKAAERELSKQRVSYIQQRERQRQRTNPLQEIAEQVRQGPLLLLRRWCEQRQSVRVVTRHERGVRGAAVGTLLAFDKHCNLVLRDVEETYTVLLKVERTTAGGATRRCPKQERRQRKLRQVFLAGSSVVLVSAA